MANTDPVSRTAAPHYCGHCRHWKRIDHGAGNCWAPMPFWMHGAIGCATWETDGANCAAWMEREAVIAEIDRLRAVLKRIEDSAIPYTSGDRHADCAGWASEALRHG